MIEKFLKTEKEAIEIELERYFRNVEEKSDDILITEYFRRFEKFVLNKNAKRINPILLIAAFKGVVNPIYLDSYLDEIRKASLAMEFLHNVFLIRDDLLDDDDIRRGKPTFHKMFEEEMLKMQEKSGSSGLDEVAASYGKAMGSFGTAAGFFLGMDVLVSSKFPEKMKLLALDEYHEAVASMVKGQIIEEYLEYYNITMSLEQYLNVAELLRANSLVRSVRIGAILAKGNLHYQIIPLGEAILRIGQAYSIRDDILDMKADISAKKKKILYILAIQNTDEEQSNTLKEIYNKENLTKKDVEDVAYIFAATNAVVIAEHFSKNLISQAKQYLKDVYPDLNKEQKLFFNEIADFTYMRDF